MIDSKHYSNLPVLVMDVIKHINEYGDFIEIDNSQKQLLFNWKCTKTEKTWTISLIKVRSLSISDKNPLSSHIRKIILDSSGVSSIWQKAIIRDDFIKRMTNLIAFW